MTNEYINMLNTILQYYFLTCFSFSFFVTVNCTYHCVAHALKCIYFEQDWFEQYRERILEAEQLILTTLNFELGVQHPYEPLTSTLQKLGFSKSVLVDLALSLISEG